MEVADDIKVGQDFGQDIAFHDAAMIDVIEGFDRRWINGADDAGHFFRVVNEIARMVDSGIKQFEEQGDARLFRHGRQPFEAFDDGFAHLAAGSSRHYIAGKHDQVAAVKAFSRLNVSRKVMDIFVVIGGVKEIAACAGAAGDGDAVFLAGRRNGLEVFVAIAPEFGGLVAAVGDGSDTVVKGQVAEE